MWQNYVNALLGLAVIVVAFLGLEGVTLSWTLGILGAAVLILGLWSATRTSSITELEQRHA
ncbi:hypothetical protein A3G63_00630 [Candidatus Kaiserbacteria bacterium RIFCSPLOWO2_12_FULL_52_8]|uniref:Uncharacterized protein n=1 Tax=Candidatus Kaiserbacteria bacterium RIFCSPHIGHO2_01_FULL_53_31 TaxID=1798481 RepID=A0A1F6CJI9_9BACT|nr:MAG: hypothetical protein A2678_01080 [Candidatus Kaiserbacteria bacterium RIFCSPHIGHO2_01_FULL_53_31]OGG92667.1 MAG: hypothetical protein A3G63_00630 [Candidatus Kaiserbacteria bacterium RIFCSPLOWO2_12_FULL_52_8]